MYVYIPNHVNFWGAQTIWSNFLGCMGFPTPRLPPLVLKEYCPPNLYKRLSNVYTIRLQIFVFDCNDIRIASGKFIQIFQFEHFMNIFVMTVRFRYYLLLTPDRWIDDNRGILSPSKIRPWSCYIFVYTARAPSTFYTYCPLHMLQ